MIDIFQHMLIGKRKKDDSLHMSKSRTILYLLYLMYDDTLPFLLSQILIAKKDDVKQKYKNRILDNYIGLHMFPEMLDRTEIATYLDKDLLLECCGLIYSVDLKRIVDL